MSYDLAIDKSVRARAKFEAISLGQAGQRYIAKPYTTVIVYDSFTVTGNVELNRNVKPSQRERLLFGNVLAYDFNTHLSVIASNPNLANKIKAKVVRGMVSELASAKRARHTSNVIAYVEALSNSLSHRPLAITPEIADCIPY